MGNLYPDILFHFTSRDNLFAILESTFAVSYARERIVGIDKDIRFGVPMVSFCDLRLSELKDHMDKYGKYGIGLSKDWANRKGLNPVFYVSRHCPFTDTFISAVEQLHRQLDWHFDSAKATQASTTYMSILNSYRYIKNYEGDLIRQGKVVNENYRFADEREWRFVPSLSDQLLPFVAIEKMNSARKKENLNSGISHLPLEFQPEDIRYLIIDQDEERVDLIRHLQVAKSRFDERTKRRLASRLLTSEQIVRDM
jgi:hypothetical protein